MMKHYVAKTGDSFNGTVTGVVSYGYSNYKVLTNKAELPTLVEGNTAREVTSLKADPEKLSIASYNIENFSAQNTRFKGAKNCRINYYESKTTRYYRYNRNAR